MKNFTSGTSRILPASKFFVSITFGMFLLLTSNYAGAQSRWNLALRSGVNIPTNHLGDADLSTGFGLEGVISYQFVIFLSAYTGWGWNTFSADKSFAGTNVDFEETGYTFGFQFNYPSAPSEVSYVICVGGLYNHIEAENNNGDIIADTGHGLGSQIDVGLSFMLGKHLKFIPYGRYRSLSKKFKIDNVTTHVELNYLSGGAGVTWSF